MWCLKASHSRDFPCTSHMVHQDELSRPYSRKLSLGKDKDTFTNNSIICQNKFPQVFGVPTKRALIELHKNTSSLHQLYLMQDLSNLKAAQSIMSNYSSSEKISRPNFSHFIEVYTFCVKHLKLKCLFFSLSSSSIGREIVECRGDRVTLAVSTVTVCYPECVYVTWVMVACTFRQVG